MAKKIRILQIQVFQNGIKMFKTRLNFDIILILNRKNTLF